MGQSLATEPHELLILLATCLTGTNRASLINHLPSGRSGGSSFLFSVSRDPLFGLLAKRKTSQFQEKYTDHPASMMPSIKEKGFSGVFIHSQLPDRALVKYRSLKPTIQDSVLTKSQRILHA